MRPKYSKKTEILTVKGENILVNIIVEPRRNGTASIGRKAVNIRIPAGLNFQQRIELQEKLKAWVRRKLESLPERQLPKPSIQYADGDVLRVGTLEYTLRVRFKDKRSSSARLAGDVIDISLSSSLAAQAREADRADCIGALVSRCVAAHRRPEIEKRIQDLNQRFFNKPVRRVYFKNMTSRWGSCCPAGNINISTRLLFAPDDVVEYVCIHELAHLIEQNHSPRFWALVASAMPDYKEKIRWLKENSAQCRF